MKQDLKTREDVHFLVSEFYHNVRGDEEIGYFFNNSITNWEEHINKLTDFWESNLFFINKYSGNPRQAHIDVDANNQHKIENRHFGIWLNHWFNTINELYEGPIAERAKNNARKMSTHLYMHIFQSRASKT